MRKVGWGYERHRYSPELKTASTWLVAIFPHLLSLSVPSASRRDTVERMDDEMDGMVSAINDMVSNNVDLKGPSKSVFGTEATPAYSFSEDSDTGVYRKAPNVLGVSAGGTTNLQVTANGVEITGDTNVSTLNVTGATNLAWDKVNDGAGSGADADLLDGQHGTYYQNADNLNAGTIPAGRLNGDYAISITGNAATATNASDAALVGGSRQLEGWNAG